MPRINPVDPQKVDTNTAATLQAVRKKLGALPNIFTTFAQAPAALKGYVQLSESLTGGRLTARQRELIALAAAQENACQYCLSAHTTMGRAAGLSDDAIERARDGGATGSLDDLDPRRDQR